MDKSITETKNLDNFIENSLKPALFILEKRRKYLLWLSFFLSALIIGICLTIAKFIDIDGKSLGALIFTSVLPYLLITEKYKLDIQKKVMEVFTAYFRDFNFAQDEYIPDYKLIKSNLFKFTQNLSSAGFYGTINNQKSMLSFLKLRLTDKDTGKNETNFEGITAMTLLNRYFDEQITIVNNADVESFEGLARIDIKDLFVFSNNPQVATNIATKDFKKWFLSLQETFNAEKYAVTFFENTAITAIYKENLECFNYNSIYQKLEYTEKMAKTYKYIIKLLELNFLFPSQADET